MKMDKVASSGNDEFYTPMCAIKPIIKYIPREREGRKTVIWCPFDTEDSLYVKAFKQDGYDVINTHLINGQNFFTTQVDCDYIISNPPYSIKTEVLDHLFKLQKPFAMLVGVVGLFESQKRFELFKNNNFEIMYFNKRISYFKDYRDQKPSLNPPFSSVYICHNILPKQIIFEVLNTSDTDNQIDFFNIIKAHS